MKVKDILRLLSAQDPEAKVVIVTLDGKFGVSHVEPQLGNRVFIHTDEED